jgi:aryl-alcohol dehydrogenase-like predicted oxidoreductase
MKTRKLGNTDIRIGEIGLGTNYVGGHNLYEIVNEDEGIRIVKQAVDQGITFIDTADVYGMGRSEELVGKALAGKQDGVVLATKGGVMFYKGFRAKPNFNNDPAYLRKALESSLKRLGRDYVDLYYIHRYDGKTPPADAFGALMRFKEEGLIRAAGLSNFGPSEIKAAMKAGPVDAIQARYNLLQREVEKEILAICEENGISFIPWGPLAFGLLGGKYSRDFKLPENDWRNRTGVFDPSVYDRHLDIVDKLKAIATGKGVAPAQVAIRWLLSRPAVGSVIAGAKNVDQLRQNVLAESLILNREEIGRIDALVV